MSAGVKALLARVAEGERLSLDDAAAAFGAIMAGDATPAQIGALLMGLRARGETVDEIAGAVKAMRAAMLRVATPKGAIDCCGTGGDGAHTLNISTAAGLVVAACGVPVAKHGNRAITSKSGTADVLQALGVTIELDAARAAQVLDEAGFVFLLAPKFHPAMRHVGPVRTELGFRTLFNLLGPLANPGGVRRQLIGAPSRAAAMTMAQVLARLGVERAAVVHGDGGLDELSTSGPNLAFDVGPDGSIRERTIAPEDAGLPRHPVEALRGGEAARNAAALAALLAGERSAFRDAVILNAAAALEVAGRGDLRTGADLAAAAIDSGKAAATLANVVAASAA